MTDNSLLPYNATPEERAQAQTVARITGVPVPVRSTWDPRTCPEELLPWLAWSFSVNEWDSDWPVPTKRAVIAAQASIHKRKGTITSIREALESAGYGGADIVEGGKNAGSNWAYYSINLKKPISNAQAAQVRRILINTAPARCVLEALSFELAPAIYDGKISFDGQYNFGVVATA